MNLTCLIRPTGRTTGRTTVYTIQLSDRPVGPTAGSCKRRITNRQSCLADQIKKNTDSVSLRFKNSDQDWPSVDLLII